SQRVREDLLCLLGGDRAVRALCGQLDLGAALEGDAEVEALQPHRDETHQDQSAEGEEPLTAMADDVERAGTRVEPLEDRLLRGFLSRGVRGVHRGLSHVTPPSRPRGRRLCDCPRCVAPRRGRKAWDSTTSSTGTPPRPAGVSPGTPRPGRALWTCPG